MCISKRTCMCSILFQNQCVRRRLRGSGSWLGCFWHRLEHVPKKLSLTYITDGDPNSLLCRDRPRERAYPIGVPSFALDPINWKCLSMFSREGDSRVLALSLWFDRFSDAIPGIMKDGPSCPIRSLAQALAPALHEALLLPKSRTSFACRVIVMYSQ